jgi:hypothetical protein
MDVELGQQQDVLSEDGLQGQRERKAGNIWDLSELAHPTTIACTAHSTAHAHASIQGPSIAVG